MPRYWIGVASAEHVRIGVAGGFMQVCHGKGGPLRRLAPGDGVVYYSPTEAFRVGPPLQQFTALGQVAAGVPYQADMGGGFLPYRRDVHWRTVEPVPIHALLPRLQLTGGRPQWGYVFRFGLVEIGEPDWACIADALKAMPGLN